jgi:hypothetical protein
VPTISVKSLLSGGLTSSAAGSNTQVQFNNSGLLGADNNFTWTTGTATLSTGNLNLSGTSRRITGDFSNATAANRTILQTSSTNGNTFVDIAPNGTGTQSGVIVNSGSDVNNSSAGSFVANGSTDIRISSAVRGTASYLPLTFFNSGSERMRIDAAGNVGIGASSPVGRLDVLTTGGGTSYFRDSTVQSFIGTNGANAFYGTPTNHPVTFISNNAERMRIAATGLVTINTATASGSTRLVVADATGNGQIRAIHSTGLGFLINQSAASGIVTLMQQDNADLSFGTNNADRMLIKAGGEVYIAGTTDQGAYNLQVNGTGVWGAGAYVNGSDERMKENIQTIEYVLDVVNSMRPVTYQYKSQFCNDTNIQPGFIAQELQQAFNSKDYINGIVKIGPKYLSVAYQNLIPILTKAIQELSIKVNTLQSELTQLKGTE